MVCHAPFPSPSQHSPGANVDPFVSNYSQIFNSYSADGNTMIYEELHRFAGDFDLVPALLSADLLGAVRAGSFEPRHLPSDCLTLFLRFFDSSTTNSAGLTMTAGLLLAIWGLCCCSVEWPRAAH